MINDHQSKPPSDGHTLYVKMESCIFMRTQIHALTHTDVHISTLHMCIHFASIAQMVKFKPVGLLKWLRHYKECSNTHWMQYTLSCAGPTLHKCCNGAHFKMTIAVVIFTTCFTLCDFLKNISDKNMFFASVIVSKLQTKTSHLWFVRLLEWIILQCHTLHLPTIYSLLTTVYKHWNTIHINAFKHFLPPVSPLLFICQHEVNRFYAV